MLSPDSIQIGKVLFSRCLEADHWPDKIQFTKYLYLLDYCQWRYKGEQATDIDWIFFHYGPWSPDASAVMNAVQDQFRLGWRDFTRDEEDHDREFRGFDPITERLGFSLEGFISKIINTFKDRDVTDLIDFCYRQTEPMRQASRGDKLDFSSVPVCKEMPLFKPNPAATDMPQLSEASQARIQAYQAKTEHLKEKARQWRRNMQEPVFEEAMNLLAHQRRSELPDLHGRTVRLDEDSVAALNEWNDE